MADLVPLADVITPNVWELGRLTDLPIHSLSDLVRAAQSTGKKVLVTSVENEHGIGALWVDGNGAWLGLHDKFDDIPKGTGDLLAAMVMARMIEGVPAVHAVGCALGGVAHVVKAALKWGAPELPIVGDREAWDALPVEMVSQA